MNRRGWLSVYSLLLLLGLLAFLGSMLLLSRVQPTPRGGTMPVVPFNGERLSRTALPSMVDEPTWAVFFSPHGGAAEAVVHEISKARKTLLVQAFGFTSEPIGDALLQAHERGVQVRLLLDRSDRSAKKCQGQRLAHAGVGVWIDAKHPIAHAKIMVIDDRTVICGSYNFTEQAEKNSEDLVIVHDLELARVFTANWQKHLEHCEPWGHP